MSEQHIALRLADEMTNYFNERGPDAEAVAAELRRLHAEVQEQCRLNGMGSEREAKLMAENKALRAAAEPVQEPVGYLWPTGRHPEFRFTQQERDGVSGTPVYLSPPQRLPLTDDQLDDIAVAACKGNLHDLRIAIEQAHGIGSKT